MSSRTEESSLLSFYTGTTNALASHWILCGASGDVRTQDTILTKLPLLLEQAKTKQNKTLSKLCAMN